VIIVSGVIVINPERTEIALERTQQLVQATRAEPGNVSYEYWAALDEAGRYHVFEEWESREALDQHNASDHVTEFMAGLGDFDISAIEVNEYEVAAKTRIF
jgi:quinol monooxygenase YgiN